MIISSDYMKFQVGITENLWNSLQVFPKVVSLLNNKYRLLSIILVLLLTDLQSQLAQDNDTLVKQKSQFKFAALPFLGYTPETRISGGVSSYLLYYGDPESHYSTCYLLAGLTQNK